MDRKWRTNRGALDTVQSLPAFRASLGCWKDEYDLATVSDLYAVYTVLHIESKDWEVRWSEDGGFYYFVTRQTVAEDGSTQAATAPEGDEDPPELVAQPVGDRVPQQPAPPQPEPLPAAGTSGDAAQPPAATTVRTQLVVPISSSCERITPQLLQRLFSVRGVQAQAMVLGLVDSHGVVSRSSLFNYIQAPLEGPGTANLELIDD